MGMSKKIMAILFVSLGLNIFIGGIIVGRVVNSDGKTIHRMMDRRARNPEKQEINKMSREIAKEVKADIKEIKRLKYNALHAIEKDPFDKGAVTAALKELREGLGVAQEKMHDKLIEKAATLPVAERTALLKTMCRGKLDMYRKYGKHTRGDRGEIRERIIKRRMMRQNGEYGEYRGHRENGEKVRPPRHFKERMDGERDLPPPPPPMSED